MYAAWMHEMADVTSFCSQTVSYGSIESGDGAQSQVPRGTRKVLIDRADHSARLEPLLRKHFVFAVCYWQLIGGSGRRVCSCTHYVQLDSQY